MTLGIIICFIPLLIAVLIFSLTKTLRLTHQLIAILLGLLAVIPISFIQFFIPDLSGLFRSPILFSIIQSMILYGLIEEILKTTLIVPLPHKNMTCLNFLLLSFLMGLALGCFESVVYFFDHLQNAKAKGAQLLYTPIYLRIFTSDIIHLTCTGLGGLFIWTCRNSGQNAGAAGSVTGAGGVTGAAGAGAGSLAGGSGSLAAGSRGRPSPRLSILITAILLHGFYDFFAGFTNNLRWFSGAVVLLAIAECRIKYMALQNNENATV